MTLTPANPVTAAELDAALPAVLAAPHDAGAVRLLCARPKPNARIFPDRLIFRPHVKQVMERYLDCGNLLNGFARIKCEDCNHEYLFSFVLEQSGNPAKGGINAVTIAHPVIKRG